MIYKSLNPWAGILNRSRFHRLTSTKSDYQTRGVHFARTSSSQIIQVLGALIIALAPLHSHADPLDGACAIATRAAAIVSEEVLGTTELAGRLRPGKEQTEGAPSAGSISVFVRVRKCPNADHEEYETWVDADATATGASTWVPLIGSLRTKDRTVWLVGKPEANSKGQLAQEVLGGDPERRMIRLRFDELRRTDIEAGKTGGIQVSVSELKWLYVRKDEGITSDGARQTFPEDLAGPNVRIRITNRKPAEADYPDDFYLVGKRDLLLSSRLPCDKCAGLSSEESRLISLTPHVKPLSELAKFAPLYLVNLQTGLKLLLPQPK